jgi:hypothetical protein
MDLENRQTFNKKKTQTYIQIKPLIKDNYVQESKKKRNAHSYFSFWIEQTIMMILFCEEDTHTHT